VTQPESENAPKPENAAEPTVAPASPRPSEDEQLPSPEVKSLKWPFPAIWLVPLLAAVATGYYFYDDHRNRGPQIEVTFGDGSGLKIGETPVTVHGVQVGKVSGAKLTDDQHQVIVQIQLDASAAQLAKEGAMFWIIKPDISAGNISGLGTIVSGPHIEALPGSGQTTQSFVGSNEAPVLLGDGMRVIVHTGHLDHLQNNSPVYYRGIQVGVVQDVRFSNDATEVNSTLFIWGRYQNLVRQDSVFWTVSGAKFNGGLFAGVELKLESLRSLISGGVAFATPNGKNGGPTSDRAKDGDRFFLNPESKKEWEEWAPRIAIEPDSATRQENSVSAKTNKQAVQTAIQGNP